MSPVAALSASAADPALIQAGSLALLWYAFAWIVGTMQGRFYGRAIVNYGPSWRGRAPLTVADLDGFIPWALAGALVGGRIGYVLLYEPAHFAAQPAEMVQLWKGGMSWHGGFAGVVVAALWHARRRGIPALALGDVTAAVYPIAHFFGWIANMVNGNLRGLPTDVLWAAYFPSGGPTPRHPSQLYEAVLEGLLLLFILALFVRGGALRRPGLVIGLFAVGYGLIHSFCGTFREPDPPLAWDGLTMGMLLSIVLMLAGAGLIWNALHTRHAGLR